MKELVPKEIKKLPVVGAVSLRVGKVLTTLNFTYRSEDMSRLAYFEYKTKIYGKQIAQGVSNVQARTIAEETLAKLLKE